jgi:D-alanine transaminase
MLKTNRGNEMIVYLNGEIADKASVGISPDERGFLFGDGAYEVMRVYQGELFRAEDHVVRFERSLDELKIRGFDPETVMDIADKLIKANGVEDGEAIFYIQVTRGAAPRKHTFPPADTPPTVYAYAKAFTPPSEKLNHGVGIILVPDIRWARCDIKTTALLPNVLANQAASEKDAEEAVFVRDGAITDGSHSNFFAVFDGCLVTPPRTNYILAGITRKVILERCQKLGIPAEESPVFEKDLNDAGEMFISGTTTDVTPVISVNGKPVGNGKPGAVTKKLQKAYFNCLYGQ